MTEENLFPYGLAGIVLDCDGVMIDSLLANRYFYNTILAWLGLPPMSPEQETYAFMATARQALLNMTPKEKHPLLDEAIRTAVDYMRDVMPRTKLMPGLVDFMEGAHKRGFRLAIDTNRTAEGIQRVLDFFALPNYFDPVISCSNAQPKPSPEGVGMIARTWHADPERILFVGDSADDRDAAMKGGARFAAFGSHVSGDLQVESFAELGRKVFAFSPAGT